MFVWQSTCCPLLALDAFLEALGLPALSSLTIFGPKLLVACMRSVMSDTHTQKKLPKQIMPAPVTCRALCAISYLQSMQQQRLDEKLILPSSLCLFLSVCLFLSISLCVCVCLFNISLSAFINVV